MSAALEVVRAALAGRRAWLVGGAVRDRVLGRDVGMVDLDIVTMDAPHELAELLARRASAACFALSDEFGAWRVRARDGAWQADVSPIQGGSLDADLALRDFTINAIAEPLDGGVPIDPLGGLADLAARRLRSAGAAAFADDPLRVLRLARLAVELDMEPDEETRRAASARAGGLAAVSGERVFAELRRIIAADGAVRGLELMRELGALAVVMPEVEALRGVEQSRFHHLDVYGHTLEVLARTVELTRPGEPVPAELADELGASWEAAAGAMREPLADEMTRGQALRWGALLHDVAKPPTRAERPDGRVTFIGHDARGAELARSLLARLRASERTRAHVAALVRNHLRLGFLVHEPQPLARRTVYAYLRACAPVEVDVTLLSVADRTATRGERAEESIDAHLRVAGPLLADALRWRAEAPAQPLVRGDELALELGIEPGPALGELLDELAAAQYAGEVASREEALAHAREHLGRR